MNWAEIVPYVFGFMALSIAGWIGASLGGLSADIKEMRKLIGELSKHIAVVAEKVGNHERRIERLEDRDIP